MNLKEYINWTKTINDYKTAPNVADTNAWGFERHGRVIVPEIQIKNAKEGDEGYWHFRNDTLNEWARKIWSNLQCVEAKIQIHKKKSKPDWCKKIRKRFDTKRPTDAS